MDCHSDVLDYALNVIEWEGRNVYSLGLTYDKEVAHQCRIGANVKKLD